MHIAPLRFLTPDTTKVSNLSELAKRVKDDFTDYQNQGWFLTTPPAVAIYRITAKGQSHTGLLALNDIRDFDAGRIKKHEKTLARREAEYHALLQEWKAVIKPVLLTFPPVPELQQWIQARTAQQAPDIAHDIPQEGEQHHYWLVQQPEQIAELQALMDGVAAVYIADGHHRTTTLAHFAQLPEAERGPLDFSYLFAAFFPDNELEIKGYHRLFQFEDAAQADIQWANLNRQVTLSPLESPRLPNEPREVVAVRGGQTYSLRLNGADTDQDRPVLDTSLLNDTVFKALFGVEDARADKRITFVDGAAGLHGMLAATQTAPETIGFLLYPVSFDQLYRLSDLNESLPPKSTWFEPRIKSGLMVHSLLPK